MEIKSAPIDEKEKRKRKSSLEMREKRHMG